MRDCGTSCSRRVLIIEDNDDSRETLQSLLVEFGHRVEAAEDGLTGVARALELKPEVLLVDIGLPGLDGYGVARRVREALGETVFLSRSRATASPKIDASLSKRDSICISRSHS